MLGALRKAAGNVGRFLSTTGKSALQKVGQTAQTIRKVRSAINTATGGVAGAAWQASKSLPGIGTIRNILVSHMNMAYRKLKVLD